MKEPKNFKNNIYSIEKEFEKYNFVDDISEKEKRDFIENNTFLGSFLHFENNFKYFDLNKSFNSLSEIELYKKFLPLRKNNSIKKLIDFNNEDIEFSSLLSKKLLIFEKRWRVSLLEYITFLMEKEKMKFNLNNECWFFEIFSNDEFIKITELKNKKINLCNNWLLWLKFKSRFLIYEEKKLEKRIKDSKNTQKHVNHLVNLTQKPNTWRPLFDYFSQESQKIKEDIKDLKSKSNRSRVLNNINTILNMFPEFKNKPIWESIEKFSFNELKKVTFLLLNAKLPYFDEFYSKLTNSENTLESEIIYNLNLIVRLRNEINHSQHFSSFLFNEVYFLEKELKDNFPQMNFSFKIYDNNSQEKLNSFYKKQIKIIISDLDRKNFSKIYKDFVLEKIIMSKILKIFNKL